MNRDRRPGLTQTRPAIEIRPDPFARHRDHRQGRRPAVATPATAAVFQPVGDTVLERWHADCRLLAVKIDRWVLQTQLASLLDAPVRTPVALDTEFDVSSGPGRTWAGLVRVLATESRVSGGLLGHAGPAEHLQQSVIAGLLALASPQYREAAGPSILGWAPRTVKRVVEAMHARPAYPFTMASLAEIAGVGARALQDAFRRHVGTAPMTYLRELRLTNAHLPVAAPPGLGCDTDDGYRRDP